MSGWDAIDLELRAKNVVRLHHEGHSPRAIRDATGLDDISVRKILVGAGIARAPNRTRASARGDNLADPKRADRALRRFSWEAE